MGFVQILVISHNLYYDKFGLVKQKNETCYAIVPRLTRQENIDCTAYEIDVRTMKENNEK